MNFWRRILSPTTARFVLALLALGFAAFGGLMLLNGTAKVETNEAAIFAVGQLFALASMAFAYYFGSTARGDEKQNDTATGKQDDPVFVEPPQ